MTKLSFERIVSYSPSKMRSLVGDVYSYPSFVPNCSDMVVRKGRGENSFFATMFVKLGPISQSYTSEVKIDEKNNIISIKAIDGPFSHLLSEWRFVKERQGTRIKFEIDFAFSNKILGKIAAPIFAQKQEEILNAFIKEAARRFG